MREWIARFRMKKETYPGWIIILSIIFLGLILETGGMRSPLHPLMNIPVVMAVVLCSFEEAVGIGLLVSTFSLIVFHMASHGSGFNLEEIVHAITLNAVALIGAFYIRFKVQENEQLRHTLEEQEALLNASQIVNASDKLDNALNSAILVLRSLIPRFSCAAIFLADEAQRNMGLAASSGIVQDPLALNRFVITEDIPGWSPDNVQPLHLSALNGAGGHVFSTLDPAAKSIICVSLRSLTVPIGLMVITSDQPDAFSDNQIHLLQSFADRIGFPIQKIRIQEGLQGLAYTDSMTGLNNFRAFRDHLEDEMKRAVRYHHALSLIIIDLDEFKQINDRYGHPAGDQLLAGVANLIRSSIREIDIPVRYGGEEFAILCPETEMSEARIVAERVRLSVDKGRFRLIPDESCAITLSAGVATYPDNAIDEDSLINAADEALYQAKRNGKNCVSIATNTHHLPSEEK